MWCLRRLSDRIQRDRLRRGTSQIPSSLLDSKFQKSLLSLGCRSLSGLLYVGSRTSGCFHLQQIATPLETFPLIAFFECFWFLPARGGRSAGPSTTKRAEASRTADIHEECERSEPGGAAPRWRVKAPPALCGYLFAVRLIVDGPGRMQRICSRQKLGKVQPATNSWTITAPDLPRPFGAGEAENFRMYENLVGRG
ncbi:hypothetical protein SAMN02745165_02801 [Malonomonas rubra DSM 5091]|uniref:Uncharacterized protein n=1 Tax=Malonomonas rubra DSM 5091 TaxID=1122189 RepID=A0A1M6KUF8_MALRU|nr:hypothetical protein SAMN02745165_02801 [Malonomonas rubra DSM 5091]